MILPIFPEGGLTSSVITTVWVGVFILAFFNLRFGWVLSGLVVPGYIVPLLILRPLAAGVIVFEAILTYLIVWWFSERLARGRFNALFGRDRFMGLVLASIAVRVTFDGWLLPQAADWLAGNGYGSYDWHSNLQSFGLVVISLMANQFWKPGLVRGLFSAAVVTGLTFVVVRYGLMEFTNFRLSGVTYVYEGLASSILASPKAYIILVFTAFIASQMNLRYGWDFSGILIPALIALQWYQPTKILSSFVEAAIIYFLAQLVMKLPILANTTIEGARKLVLFFNVSFAYKLVLGHALNFLALDIKTTDFYGFGYLLSTLLAIKAYDKDIFPRVMRSTFEVSIAGAAAGNLAGFLLVLLLPGSDPASAALTASGRGSGNASTGQLLAAASGDAWLRRSGIDPPEPGRGELRELGDAIELLDSGVAAQFIAPGLAQGKHRLTVQGDGTIAIARREGIGRDLLLFNPAARRPLAVVVSDAAARPGLAAAGEALFRQQSARWLVVTAPPPENPDDVPPLLAVLRRAAPGAELAVLPGSEARLELAGAGATGIDLAALRGVWPDLAVSFGQDGTIDRAALQLGDRPLAALFAPDQMQAEPPLCSISVLGKVPPPDRDLARLAFVRFEIAEPLSAALAAGSSLPAQAVHNAAQAGLSLASCRDGDELRWLLASRDGLEGTFLFNPGARPGRIVEIHGDRRRVIEAGWELTRTWGGQALLVAPGEEQLIGSQRSLFGVVSQTVIRAQGAQGGQLLQLRAAPSDVARGQGTRDVAIVTDRFERGGWLPQLAALSKNAGFTPQAVDRTVATAGLEVAPNLSLRYLTQTIGWRHATLWLRAPPRPFPPAEQQP